MEEERERRACWSNEWNVLEREDEEGDEECE
jgi:hypothetical protein